MSSFRIGNKHYKIIPFLITTGTLLFFVFWIGGISYKYHLETEERRKLQELDIKTKARELNEKLHQENQKLKDEMDHLKKILKKIEVDKLELTPAEKNEVENLLTEKEIVYQNDGKTIKHIKILDPQTKKEIKRNVYRLNGISIYHIDKYNPEGKIIQETYYYSDGISIYYINEYTSEGIIIKRTYYYDNGKDISSIDEFNPEGEKIQETYYNKDGTIKKTKTY